MTDEMLAPSCENQRKAGLENVEWLRGEIEAIPLAAETVDVLISKSVMVRADGRPMTPRQLPDRGTQVAIR